MRRTGVTLVAAALLGLPVLTAGAADASGGASGGAAAVGPAATCTVSALPVPAADAATGGQATAILEQGAYLGEAGSPSEGLLWRGGTSSAVPITPYSVNASGLAVGSVGGGAQGARLRLGGTPEKAPVYNLPQEVNAAGDSVGSYVNPAYGLYYPIWWKAGDAAPVALTNSGSGGAWAIDDLGYKVGYSETPQGQRSEIIWGPNGDVVRQYGPYAKGDTQILPEDVDDGVALATRVQGGAKDLVLVDVASGAITPVANTSGLDAALYKDGWVVGMQDLTTPVLVHGGVRQVLAGPSGTTPRKVNDLKVFGSTAVLAGLSWLASGYTDTATIWQCG